jgi:ParB/RepB/Spo0J family partition protein
MSSKNKLSSTLMIPLSEIILSEHNVRKILDAGTEDSTLEDLTESIKRHGLLNPISVKKKGDKFEIIAGQRRYLACRNLGLKTIRATVLSEIDETESTIISLIENVHRAELHPIDKGSAYLQLYKKFGSYSRVSKETSVSSSTVKRYLMLMKLSPSIQELLDTNNGPAGICTLAMLAELFPDFSDQEYVLDYIGKFKQQVQIQILRQSSGDIKKIDLLVEEALCGCFDLHVCRGISNCPYIPEELRNIVSDLISDYNVPRIKNIENPIMR